MCANSTIKMREAAQMFMMVDYVSEMTVSMANMNRFSICSSGLFLSLVFEISRVPILEC